MRRSPFLALVAALLTVPAGAAALVPPGSKVADFQVEDPDGRVVRLADFAPAGVLVLYEDKSAASLNEALKKRLTALAKEKALPAGFGVLPVADLRVFRAWPAKPIAQQQLRERSKALGKTIHADWNGGAAKALDVTGKTSTVVLLGPDRTVRWSGSGRLEAEALDALVAVVKALPPVVRGKGPRAPLPRGGDAPRQGPEAGLPDGIPPVPRPLPFLLVPPPRAATPDDAPAAADEAPAAPAPAVAATPEPVPAAAPDPGPAATPDPGSEPAAAPVPVPDRGQPASPPESPAAAADPGPAPTPAPRTDAGT